MSPGLDCGHSLGNGDVSYLKGTLKMRRGRKWGRKVFSLPSHMLLCLKFMVFPQGVRSKGCIF